MEKLKEVVIVEGRDDIRRLREVMDVDCIETHGLGLNDEIMDLIEEAYHKRGIIIFTDPDYAGETIRKQIMQRCPEAKQAFITRREGEPNKKGNSLGVEHASDDAIYEALTSASSAHLQKESHITDDLLRHYQLIGYKDSKQRREWLGETLRIGYTNGKQLKKRLALFQITQKQLEEAMEEFEHDRL